MNGRSSDWLLISDAFPRSRYVESGSGNRYISEILSECLDADKDKIYGRLTKTTSSEVTIKKHIDKEKIDKLLTYSDFISGVYYSRDNTRVYPYGEFLSQVLGFTSTDGKGQSGLELYYDDLLKGKDGEILYETDIVGIEI